MRAEVSEGSIVAGWQPGGADNTGGKLPARDLYRHAHTLCLCEGL